GTAPCASPDYSSEGCSLLIPGCRVDGVPVVLADTLDEQEAAELATRRSDPVRAIDRDSVAFAHGKQDALGRAEHFDLDRAFDTKRRVDDSGVVVPRNLLARLERAFLHLYVGTLGDPVDLADANIGFSHGLSLSR